MFSRALLPLALIVSGCTYVPLLTPYKIDIQQGNVVTQEMIARLKPGMTRAQVRFTLGTPLVVDPFRGDRWDYVYVYMKQGTVTEQRRVMVVFKDDKLDRIEGDVAPAGDGKASVGKPLPPGARAEPTQNSER